MPWKALLCIVNYHVQLSKGNQPAVVYTSVTIAMVTFIGILTYHIFQQLRYTKLWKMPKVDLELKKLNKKLISKQALNSSNSPIDDPENLNSLISFVNLCLMTCHSPPTVLSEHVCIPTGIP